jgi:hypothetical protein
VIYRKIYDTTKAIIPGGRINEYWTGQIKSFFNKYRQPHFPFKKNIDYLEQKDILKKYNLFGFEYGNWVTQNERYNFLICSHFSLYDLALILGFKNIGFGKITIAFGARGHSGAIAHFEPGTNAINLTRVGGWQSLAHEYGHALDFYFGGYIEQNKNHYALSEGRSTHFYVPLSQYEKSSLRYKMNDLINTINTVEKNGKITYSESFKRIKDSGDYYRRRCEIFARFFEKWVQYKLSKKGIRNYFLSKDKYQAKHYVNRIDFARALPKMELLMNTIKKNE